jgi:hypothetical protein
MAPERGTEFRRGVSGRVTTIAAMPKRLRPILLALLAAGVSAGLLGCGGDDGPDPSLSAQEAGVLVSRLDEIQSNVDVGSCLVAADRTEELLAEIEELPDSVNQEVRNALTRGTTNLLDLLEDPEQCEPRTTTVETTTTAPTTTDEDETTTQRTRPETTTTTPTQTQPSTTTTPTQPTTPTTPGGASGGIGPGP